MPSPAPAADAFLAAWSALRPSEMLERLDQKGRRARRDAGTLRRWLRRTLERGAVTGFSVRRAGPVVSDGARQRGPTAVAPYSVSYESRAASAPAVLSGELELIFDRDDRQWRAQWGRSAMWPGVAGATGFAVVHRWPRRGRLLDRSGVVLARGGGLDRTYPLRVVGGTLVGHLESPVPSAARARGDRHSSEGLVGASGLEAAYDERLAGRPSARLVVVGRAGRILSTLGRRPGRPARDVRTTVHARVQRAVQEAWGSTPGAAVVLDAGSGDLLAAATSGEIDPNSYVGVDASPFNRALSGLYPPGSAMKVVTASAALDSGAVTPRTGVTGPKEYKGVRNFESGAFGTIDFATALKFSVNTAFAQVAEKLGAPRLTRYARRFGFGESPETALDAATSTWPRPREPSDLMWGSIGQAQVLATPLQMASVAATVANGGVRMEPRAAFLEPPRARRVVSRRTAATMTRLMQEVVEGGTGERAALPGVSIAGKTGTAEVDIRGKRRNHAWFICFAPAQRPEVAVAVVAELGGIGGEVAAPLAGRILSRVLPLVR